MNKLNYILAFLLVFAVSYFSCKKEDVSSTPYSEIAEEDLSINFLEEEGLKSIDIEINIDDWLVNCDQGWCSPSVLNSKPAIARIVVLENTTLDIRTAKGTIKTGSLGEVVTIMQLG